MKLSDFLYRVDQIKNEQPRYELGHDGSDGACDCVGLPIGATRRAGTPYKGIHGSNYFARKMTADLEPIHGESSLSVGDLVYKAREPGDDGYDLPSRYKKGGEYYNGDLRDYCHIGVVTNRNPLRITHMTSPTAKVDTKIGKWKYHGKYTLLDGVETSNTPGSSGEKGDEQMEEYVEIYGGSESSPVNMRQRPSTSAALVDQIPQHSQVQFLEDGGSWVKVKYKGKTGWVKADFVHSGEKPVDENTGKPSGGQTEGAVILTLNYPQAVSLLPILESLKEQIEQKVGRG